MAERIKPEMMPKGTLEEEAVKGKLRISKSQQLSGMYCWQLDIQYPLEDAKRALIGLTPERRKRGFSECT